MNKIGFENPNAEIIRLKGLYRKLILSGKVNLPYESLKNLIGPDCAYRFYKYNSSKFKDNEK